MKNIKQKFVFVLLAFLSLSKLEASEQPSLESTKFVIPDSQIIPIKDTQSNKQYALYIKLPATYKDNKDRHYPVIYFTDALWHIELLSAATYFMMEDVILVGISWQTDIKDDVKQQYGAHFSRFGDYSFQKTINPKHPKIQYGQAKNHLSFIRKDVFSYVEAHYRTQTDNRSYLGFSSGGLFGLYALMTHPETFKNYILGSPSIWRHGTALFDLEHETLRGKKPKINLFVTYGDLEKELAPTIEHFVNTFKNKQYSLVSSISLTTIESAGHSDSFPEMGVRGVKWLSSLPIKETKK
ncbi:hypothetical protein PSECIP111951_00070 [Pseudoalteromonas holothuriae]|uniref:Alpha/beta hydrolase n=1 Tax=Pseudoalteromonas holothuriae TaxID=2963714 RepID=A0ABM9GER5_9GAMM|nr:alpha/beta hydrolase-fold protein [Pseudoalteromonas sp. CIP111951]CAH9049899.1 hypothetical protein PSECIP111951_00070 [Pseudoalteromonas sp. CIP111951]